MPEVETTSGETVGFTFGEAANGESQVTPSLFAVRQPPLVILGWNPAILAGFRPALP
jgi:hypothetical protein